MKDKKNTLIIYHSEDNDGVFACAITKNYLINELHCEKDSIVTAGHTYSSLSALYKNDPSFKEISDNYEYVIIVDISFNEIPAMKTLKQIFGKNFTWIDHHSPIIKESIRNRFCDINGLRDTNHSALMNAWRYWYDPLDVHFNDGNCPEIFKILSGWDSWSFKYWGYTNEFAQCINEGVNDFCKLDVNEAVNFVNDIIHFWKTSLNSQHNYWEIGMIDELEKAGNDIIEYNDNLNESIIKEFGDLSWVVQDTYKTTAKCCALFSQLKSSSKMFKSLKDTDISHGIIFKRRPTGVWTVSLYNIHDDCEFHCGNYLQAKYNGGGHKGAAGCTLTEEQFVELLKTKTL